MPAATFPQPVEAYTARQFATNKDPHIGARDRSYDVRSFLAGWLAEVGALAPRPGHDFSCRVPVVVDRRGVQVEATLLSTSNAGFRGIEGHFMLADGSTFSTSLGWVVGLH